MSKETDYTDLERLPDHNHLKHFMNWLCNKPKWLFEDLYKSFFLKQKIELELTLLRNEIQELSVQLKTKLN